MPQSLDKTLPPVAAPAPARSAAPSPAARPDDKPSFALPAAAPVNRRAAAARRDLRQGERATEPGRRDEAGTAERDKARTAGRDSAETARDRAGTKRDKAGTKRDASRRNDPPPWASRTAASGEAPDRQAGGAAPIADPRPGEAPAEEVVPDAGEGLDDEAGEENSVAPADPTLAARPPAGSIPDPAGSDSDAAAGGDRAAAVTPMPVAAPAAAIRPVEAVPAHAAGTEPAVEAAAGAGRAIPAGLQQAAANHVPAASRGEASAGRADRDPEGTLVPDKPPFEPPKDPATAEPGAGPAAEAMPEVRTPAGSPAAPGPARAAQAASTDAPPGPAPVPVVPQVPLGAVPIEIGLRSLAGVNRFEIRLDPAELGRIDVSLEIGESGDVKAHLVVDRVETLALLQRDARTLERAFEQAGLKPSEGGVDLSLRDPAQDGRQPGRDGREGDRAGTPRPAAPSDEAPGAGPPPAPRRPWGGRVGVDVRI